VIEFEVGVVIVQVMRGDLVEAYADAVVCPANSYGHMRGGVAQALRVAGGDEIESAARSAAPVGLGEAIATTAGRLPCNYVIHAPTMREPVEICSPQRIKAAVRAALREATELGCRVIAIPGLGTGTGEVSFEEGAMAIVEAISQLERGMSLEVVQLIALDTRLEQAFVVAARAVGAELMEPPGASESGPPDP
jgi:O-acetyl-ADP-ribose deacetylase (regulator of RNase III)